MQMEKYKAILEKYLPEATVDPIFNWLIDHRVSLRITRTRTSKLGDYRPPHNGRGHQISINHDLNPYAFLITLVHEMAHLLTWENHRNKVKAHGAEWKKAYRELMDPFMKHDIYPPDLHSALRESLVRSFASSSADLRLSRMLQQYDQNRDIRLEELETGSIFRLLNGRTFSKGPLVRKRYRCICLENKRVYLVNPLARVKVVEGHDGESAAGQE
jgi:SprT protein